MAGEMSPTFVEEQGSAVGQGEAARLVGASVGEGAGLVAEQFRFQQGVGKGRTIDGDEGLVAARGKIVDRPGEEFLARAAGALDQDGAVAFGDLGQNL